MKNRKINWRAFTSVYMGFSAIIVILSGIILYLSPPGRVAHWSYWSLFWLTKTEWQAIHTIFTFLFVLIGGFHVYYNWKPLMNYLRRKTKESFQLRKEMFIALVLTVFIFAGTYNGVPPFSTVMDFGETLTDSWSSDKTEPPIPHAEQMTVGEFARLIKVPEENFIRLLNKNGYSVKDTNMTLEDLAAEYDVTPSKFFELVGEKQNSISSGQANGSTKYAMGSGFGRKKLSEIFEENNLSWEEGVKILEKANIKVESDDRLKTIADDNNVTPIDIIKALGLI
jgi:phage antirepressor YoqD-like protein